MGVGSNLVERGRTGYDPIDWFIMEKPGQADLAHAGIFLSGEGRNYVRNEGAELTSVIQTEGDGALDQVNRMRARAPRLSAIGTWGSG